PSSAPPPRFHARGGWTTPSRRARACGRRRRPPSWFPARFSLPPPITTRWAISGMPPHSSRSTSRAIGGRRERARGAGPHPPSRAARDLAAVARNAHGKAALQLVSWREAARLFARVREIDHSRWAWSELEKMYRYLPAKAREKLPADAVAAAAEAHLQLGSRT